MGDKVEFVLHHEFMDVIVGNSKSVKWVSSQLYSIRYLDGGDADNPTAKKQVAEQMDNLSRTLHINGHQLQSENQEIPLHIQNTLSDSGNLVHVEVLVNDTTASKTETTVDNSNVLRDTTSSLPSSNSQPRRRTDRANSDLVRRAVSKARQLTLCTICKKTYESILERKKHQLIHFGITPIRCRHCFHVYAYSSTFYSHTCKRSKCLSVKVPQDNSSIMLRCKLCQKKIQGLNSLIAHETSHTGQVIQHLDNSEPQISKLDLTYLTHSQKGSSVWCQQCQKEFKNEVYMKMHQQIHKFDGRSDVDDTAIERILMTALDAAPVVAALTEDVTQV